MNKQRTLADPTGTRHCSVAGCGGPAVAVERRRTASMPATGFYPVCAAHLELPSARAALLAGLAVHETGHGGWAIYPTEFSYDLYPGGEGPQRDLSLTEVLEAIGGDGRCRLAPAGREKWGTLVVPVQQRLLDAECQECPNESAANEQWLARCESAIEEVQYLVRDGKLSASEARPILVALENRRHECVLKSL